MQQIRKMPHTVFMPIKTVFELDDDKIETKDYKSKIQRTGLQIKGVRKNSVLRCHPEFISGSHKKDKKS